MAELLGGHNKISLLDDGGENPDLMVVFREVMVGKVSQIRWW